MPMRRNFSFHRQLDNHLKIEYSIEWIRVEIIPVSIISKGAPSLIIDIRLFSQNPRSKICHKLMFKL